MEIRKVEYKDEKNEKERKELEQIRCFLKRITWRKIGKEEETGGKSGITLIELYALYMCKGAGIR